MITEVKKRVAATEYCELPEGPPQQLIDGEIIMSPAPTAIHQVIVRRLLELFVGREDLGVAIPSPIDVVFTEGDVFQPDIVFISSERKEIIKDKIMGAPDLVIEVLSPSNAYYDLTHKKNVYEETGVKEFWIVDPEEKTVEIYENVKNTFVIFSKAKKSGVVESKLLSGLRVDIVKLFAPI